MHYLGLALYAEGKTDYYFLCPLLHRLCVDICNNEVSQYVEVSEVLRLDHPASSNDASRERRIFDAAVQAGGAWRILFVHADGAGDPAQARERQVQPAIELLGQDLAQQGVGVAVIPIRETEAWAIADGKALRRVFGTELTDDEMELPMALAAIEAVADPKAALDSAFRATRPSGRRKRQGVSPMLNALGEQVSLQRLRQLAAFASLEVELKAAMRQLRMLP